MRYLDWGRVRVLNCRKTTWRPWLPRWPLMKTLRAIWMMRTLTHMAFSKGGRCILSLPGSMCTSWWNLLSNPNLAIKTCFEVVFRDAVRHLKNLENQMTNWPKTAGMNRNFMSTSMLWCNPLQSGYLVVMVPTALLQLHINIIRTTFSRTWRMPKTLTTCVALLGWLMHPCLLCHQWDGSHQKKTHLWCCYLLR